MQIRKLFAGLLAAIMVLSLAACGNNSILVVYFSWSGNLDSMAHWVADETGGDLYRVTAKEPYPTDYR